MVCGHNIRVTGNDVPETSAEQLLEYVTGQRIASKVIAN